MDPEIFTIYPNCRGIIILCVQQYGTGLVHSRRRIIQNAGPISTANGLKFINQIYKSVFSQAYL
jgi:hypothetical protein